MRDPQKDIEPLSLCMMIAPTTSIGMRVTTADKMSVNVIFLLPLYNA